MLYNYNVEFCRLLSPRVPQPRRIDLENNNTQTYMAHPAEMRYFSARDGSAACRCRGSGAFRNCARSFRRCVGATCRHAFGGWLTSCRNSFFRRRSGEEYRTSACEGGLINCCCLGRKGINSACCLYATGLCGVGLCRNLFAD